MRSYGVLCSQEYCCDYYRGLIDLSTVLRCQKYCRCRYHCRIEHPLVSRIMVIEFNLINPRRDSLRYEYILCNPIAYPHCLLHVTGWRLARYTDKGASVLQHICCPGYDVELHYIDAIP